MPCLINRIQVATYSRIVGAIVNLVDDDCLTTDDATGHQAISMEFLKPDVNSEKANLNISVSPSDVFIT